VNSSCVVKLRYDTQGQRLDIVYAEGKPYEYFHVPRSKYRALMRAPSKGEFVNLEIKPKHPFKKLNG